MNDTSSAIDLEQWGHPKDVTPELQHLWTQMTKIWKNFTGSINEPSLDIGGAKSKGRTVTIDPFPRGFVDVRGVGEYLPFCDGRFTSVVLESVLKHVLSPTKVLEEARRVSTVSGWLYISSPVNHIDKHRHNFTSQSLCELVENSGYKIVRKMGLGFSNNRLNRIARKIGLNLSLIRVPTKFCRMLLIVANS